MLLNTQAFCEWGRSADEPVELPLRSGCHVISDGNGGCWVNGAHGICHIDRLGDVTWDQVFDPLPEYYGPTGFPILTNRGEVIFTVDDMEWETRGEYPFDWEELTKCDIYIQKTNLDRELMWDEEGIQLNRPNLLQSVVGMYAGPIDNTYLIHSVRNSTYGRLQLINEEGDFLWGNDGIGSNLYYLSSKIVMSSDHCIIVARSVTVQRLLITKIDSVGEQLWNSRISPQDVYVRRNRLRASASDGAGGVLLAYEYERHITIDDTLRRYLGIRAMRISSEGDSLWTRQVYEREKGRGETRLGEIMQVNYVGSGHFFVAWADYGHALQVVALDINGGGLWDGPVDIKSDGIYYSKLNAVESYNSVCYAWIDRDPNRRENGEWVNQIWGQRISADGNRLWGDRGSAIIARVPSGSNYLYTTTTDGAGGMITALSYNSSLQMINRNGEIGVVLDPVGVDEEIDNRNPAIPSPILNIYPNPVNSHTNILFSLPHAGFTSLEVYDPLGRLIEELTPRRWMNAGNHSVSLDGMGFASGTYYIFVNSNGYAFSRPINFVK